MSKKKEKMLTGTLDCSMPQFNYSYSFKKLPLKKFRRALNFIFHNHFQSCFQNNGQMWWFYVLGECLVMET